MKSDLSSREVAELARAPVSLVNKAVEEKVLSPVTRKVGNRTRRFLPLHAVTYAAVVSKLGVSMKLDVRRRLASNLSKFSSETAVNGRVELAPAVEIRVGDLIGDALARGERYVAARDAHIVSDGAILGGAAIIRGTRMTAHSVLGRVAQGDTLAEIHRENPDIPLEALDTAYTYARSHRPVGRPSDKPWRP